MLKFWIKTFIVVVIAFGVTLFKVNQLDNPSFIDDVINETIYITLGSLFVILLIWALIKYKRSKKKPKKFMYFPLLMCFVIFSVLIITPPIYNLQDRSPKILCGRYYHGIKFGDEYYISFRADGTYKLDRGDLLSRHYSRGDYKMQGNIIVCDDQFIDTIIRTNRFLIRTDTMYEVRHLPFRDSTYTVLKKRIYSITKKGEVIGNSAVFDVEGKRGVI